MEHIDKSLIKVGACSGSLLSDCIADIIVLALRENVEVELNRNERMYIAYPDKIRETVVVHN